MINDDSVKPTLKELECLRLFRGLHESRCMISNNRFNNRSEEIQREIARLNEKIAEETTDHVVLQHSAFLDDENGEFMIEQEDSVSLYTWMKEQLLKRWAANLKLQEKRFRQYACEGQMFYFMHQSGCRQLNLEDPSELDLSWFEQVKPSAGDQLDYGISNYRIQMKFDSPPSSREDSSEEEEEEEEL